MALGVTNAAAECGSVIFRKTTAIALWRPSCRSAVGSAGVWAGVQPLFGGFRRRP